MKPWANPRNIASGKCKSLRWKLACGALAGCLTLRAQAPNVNLDDPAVINRGRELFAATCSVGYCHGKEGRAGRGPRLAGRKFERDYLFRTITNGINKSLMPAFKSQLSEEQIWEAVAYILSLSGDASGSPTPKAGSASAPAPPAVPAKPSQVAPADPNAGDSEAGRALFFDASNPRHCAACHQFQGKGGDVGPDLTSVAVRPSKEILRDILDPDARLAAEPVTVVTKSGERITGVKKQEVRDRLRIYDTSASPPVLRTIYKDQIQSVIPEKVSPMPHDYGQTLTRKQLLDVISFLKSAPISLREIE
jgi:putative heme-binding domain-containing protein